MESSSIIFLIVSGLIAFAWLLPVVIIASSKKTTGGEKIAWLL